MGTLGDGMTEFSHMSSASGQIVTTERRFSDGASKVTEVFSDKDLNGSRLGY
jgi:hypothetical protein